MPTPYHNFRTQRGWHFPDDVLALLDRLLDLGGTYGDPEARDPSTTTSYPSSTTRATWRGLPL